LPLEEPPHSTGCGERTENLRCLLAGVAELFGEFLGLRGRNDAFALALAFDEEFLSFLGLSISRTLSSGIDKGILKMTEYNRPFFALLLSLGSWLVGRMSLPCVLATTALVALSDDLASEAIKLVGLDVVLSLAETRAAARVSYFCWFFLSFARICSRTFVSLN